MPGPGLGPPACTSLAACRAARERAAAAVWHWLQSVPAASQALQEVPAEVVLRLAVRPVQGWQAEHQILRWTLLLEALKQAWVAVPQLVHSAAVAA